ncbi:MAG: hypothetical protein IPL42_02885 [Saprospiraceae bacterium]|nr:hypothetical protein [Saprospiraceae bacterium]
MKSRTFFYFLVCLGAFVCLFIPFWFAPFIMALFVGMISNQTKIYTCFAHFAVYMIVCAIYCYAAYATGSHKLAAMIGEIFKEISTSLLIIISSLVYGMTACLGAWLGTEWGSVFQKKQT